MINTKVFALLAAGGLLLLTQKKANAAPVTTGSIQPPTVPAYLRTPSSAAQYGSFSMGRSQVQSSPVTAGLNFLTELVKGKTLAGGYSTGYNPQSLGLGISAEMDGNIGESQARTYYANHADEFLPDPVDYAQVNATPWAQAAINDLTDY
jgi:hypothetical protein